jgi:hypothetical protein
MLNGHFFLVVVSNSRVTVRGMVANVITIIVAQPGLPPNSTLNKDRIKENACRPHHLGCGCIAAYSV